MSDNGLYIDHHHNPELHDKLHSWLSDVRPELPNSGATRYSCVMIFQSELFHIFRPCMAGGPSENGHLLDHDFIKLKIDP